MVQAEAARLTMERMEALGLALENYRHRHGSFPMSQRAASEVGLPVASILGALQGNGVGGLEGVDGWGRPILWDSDDEGYVLLSMGADGQRATGLKYVGPEDSWDTDIIYANGRFLTWPCDVPNPPDPDMPCFVTDTGDARVFSIKQPLKLPRSNELENAGASVGAGIVDFLTGFSQNVIVDGAQAAGPNPYLAGLTVVVTYLQRKADQHYDPVTILPLALGLKLHEDGDHLALSAGAGTATVLPVVVLDFLKVAANGGRVHPERYGDGLGLWVRGGFPPFESLESRELMSAGQLRALRGDRTYIVIPRLPLDFRIYESHCRKCEGADGTRFFKLGAGARYGAYGRPGGPHEDEVWIRLEPNGVQLRLTSANLTESDDLDAACRAEFGQGARLADWQDVKASWERHGKNLPDLLGLQGNALIQRNGRRFWMGRRHYFISRHDGEKPSYYLAHDELGGHVISLGSWYDRHMPALCLVEDGQRAENGTQGSCAEALGSAADGRRIRVKGDDGPAWVPDADYDFEGATPLSSIEGRCAAPFGTGLRDEG